MAAALHDIVIEEGVDYILSVKWYDEDGNLEDVEGYGAEFILKPNKENDTSASVKITHTSTSDGVVTVNNEDGEFLIQVDRSAIEKLAFKKGYWQLDVWPSSGSPLSNRQRLVKGKSYIEPSL